MMIDKKRGKNCSALTVDVRLLRVGHQPAVVPVVGHAVVVVVVVAGVAFAVAVVVGLVAVGDVGAVVPGVLLAVLVNVLVVITPVSHQVVVGVPLRNGSPPHPPAKCTYGRCCFSFFFAFPPLTVRCLPAVGCVGEDSCRTGHRRRPSRCLSARRCRPKRSCRAHLEPLVKESGQVRQYQMAALSKFDVRKP